MSGAGARASRGELDSLACAHPQVSGGGMSTFLTVTVALGDLGLMWGDIVENRSGANVLIG